jgi:hypothetical protein
VRPPRRAVARQPQALQRRQPREWARRSPRAREATSPATTEAATAMAVTENRKGHRDHRGHAARLGCASRPQGPTARRGSASASTPGRAVQAQTRKPPAARTDIGRGAPITSPVTRASAWGAGGTQRVGLHAGTWGRSPYRGPGGRSPWGSGHGGMAAGWVKRGPHAGRRGPRGMGGRGSPPSGGGRWFSPARYGGTGREAGAA